jgi:hypothetical protein
VLVADGTVLGDALFAAAKPVGLLVIDTGLDLDAGLLLSRIEGRRRAQDWRKAVGILKIGEPAVALKLSAGDYVGELAGLEFGNVLVKGHAAVEHHGSAPIAMGYVAAGASKPGTRLFAWRCS